MTELLCIQTHSKGLVIAGNTYPLVRVAKLKCDCGINEVVDVGHATRPGSVSGCNKCKTIWSFGTMWYGVELFAQIGTIDECEQYEEKQLQEL